MTDTIDEVKPPSLPAILVAMAHRDGRVMLEAETAWRFGAGMGEALAMRLIELAFTAGMVHAGAKL